MTIPVPYPVEPGDRLRVVKDNPDGTDLQANDLVTAMAVGIHVTNGLPVPVVQVSTAHGPQMLTFASLEPIDLPVYTPGEKDDVVDAFFFKILGEDAELRAWAVQAREELAANDPKEAEAGGNTVTIDNRPIRAVGQVYTYADQDGDELEVTYCEQECPSHGRHGGFHFSINDEEEVIIPAARMDGLIRYLFMMKKHSERQDEA